MRRPSPRLLAAALVLGLAAGCTTQTTAPACAAEAPATAPPRRVYFARSLAFVKAEEDGTVRGFDLDGKVSDRSDADSCRRRDLVAPDGTPGIDNQLALLWPGVEGIVGDGLDGLVDTAIKEGTIMVLFELEGVDDLENDDCVTLHIYQGVGVPEVGTDNVILANQTFDIHPESPHSVATNARIENGKLIAGPFDALVPMLIYTVFVPLRAHDVIIEMDLHDDGTGSMLLSAGIETEQILAIGEHVAAMDDNAARINSLLLTVLDTTSDLDRQEDGECHQISGALAVEVTPAFLFEDAVRPETIVDYSDGTTSPDVGSGF